jgi:hypothetical protein
MCAAVTRDLILLGVLGRLGKVMEFLCVARHNGSGQFHETAAEYSGVGSEILGAHCSD